MKEPKAGVFISIPNAKEKLSNALDYFIALEGQNKAAVWLNEYEEVSLWLEDNKGRGLLLYGECGLGKTFIARYVLPALLLKYCNRVVNSFDMNEANKNPDDVLSKHIIALDDIGTEEQSVKYGDRRFIVPEIVDYAEKYGKMLILTTNLNAAQLSDKYGSRTLDRIIATTKRIEFKGKSFRK